eukprot:3338209-Prymnesium_polylepis.1
MTHEATILRVLRAATTALVYRLLESLSPPADRLLESTTWMFGHVDVSGLSGYVWISGQSGH